MNILLATDVFPPKSGGSGWSTFYLARALLARGHRVQVIQPRAGARGAAAREFQGVNVVEVGYQVGNVPGLRAAQRTRALNRTLSTYIAAHAREYDVVHAQHVLSIAAAAEAKAQTPFRLVSTVRDYWAVCLYGTLWRDNVICPVCRGGEITRCLAQRYGNSAKYMLPAVPLVERELERRQRALQASDVVIGVSSFVAETLRGMVSPEKLTVIPNLIDVAETRAVARSSQVALPDKPYLMFIGKLNALKGADLLPQILKESGVDAPLVVAGTGELEPVLGATPQIQLRGWLNNADTLKLLENSQALLFPSRWAEPLARTTLEAQALGVPTIACNTGGTRDIIDDTVNGLLAENVHRFASQLRRLMNDPALREQIHRNSLATAQSRFSPDAILPQLEAVYARRPVEAHA